MISISLGLYGLSAALFTAYLFTRHKNLAVLARLALVVSVAAHALAVLRLGLRVGGLPLASLPEAVNMMILLAGATFVPLVMRRSTTALGAFFAPVACFCLALVSPALGISPAPIRAFSFWYPLHTLSVIVGEALFIVAATTSLAYLLHERIIRRGAIHASGASLPPLSILEKILMHALSTGFIAITAGMLLGGFWAASAGVGLAGIAPKIMAGALTWAVFAFSIHQRYAIGWRGKRTAVITLAGFALMLALIAALQLCYPQAHGMGLLP